MHKRLFAALALAAAVSGSAFAQTPATNQTPPKPAAPPAAAAPATTAPAVTAPATTARTPLIDINTATADELQKLKGVGQARAEAIIKGRPYKAKDELLDKKILPSNVYQDVKDQIVARQRS